MNWKVILIGISLLRELLRYLREHKNCATANKQKEELEKIKKSIETARSESKELTIIV